VGWIINYLKMCWGDGAQKAEVLKEKQSKILKKKKEK